MPNCVENKMKCSLITGGAGFIGSHVARHCLDLGHEVVVVDDLSGGFRDQVPPGATFVEGSVVDEALVSEIFETYKIDYVYHLAAYAAEGLSHFIRRFNYTSNLIGSVNLINESVRHEIECFVFASSIAVYGRNQLPMVESLTPCPEDPYGISKYAVELDLAAAHEMFGLNSIVFRPHNVYGEHQNLGDTYRNVIGIFMNKIMQGMPMTVFGDGAQTRAFSHIDDVALPIARAVEVSAAYQEAINIGADQPHTIRALAEKVAASMGVEPRIEYLRERNEVKHAYASHDKAARLFGISSTVSLDEGLAGMANWAQRTGIRSGRIFESIEIEKNLPESWSR